jgi:hypothetical protein
MVVSPEGGLTISGESDYSGVGASRDMYTSFQLERGEGGPSPREKSGFEAFPIMLSVTHSAGAGIPGAVAPRGPGCHLRVNGEQQAVR